MIYPAHFEQKIGFTQIREALSARCATQSARELVAAMAFSTDAEALGQALDLTREMLTVLRMEQNFPLDGFVDLLPLAHKLSFPSYYLEPKQLLQLSQALETVRTMLRFFEHAAQKTAGETYPKLRALAQDISYYPVVLQRIDALLDKFGDIRDTASPKLYEIRRSKREKEQSVNRRIQQILKKIQADGLAGEEAEVSVRDGRMLIPISAANKRKVAGYIYDESASGKTSFIEPFEIVNLNNEIRELGFAEQREILVILMDFADFLRPYGPELEATGSFLAQMDFLLSKARLAEGMQAGRPVLQAQPGMVLIRARHPLLEKSLRREGKEIVPLSVSLSPEKRILLISGPNAGGKSVCLKTVGLLQYMLQCGLLIPASESSELGLFHSLFIDIGDEQSLENDLSTYSSHLLNMRAFLAGANKRSLILIDEFGTGTEPTAGGALAEALLHRWEDCGCYGIITTHYSNLKFYATASNAVVNGAMQFDVQQIRPLFKLEMGVPGNSFAFELARKMGLPESVIQEAQQKTGADYIDLERQLRSIARNRRHWEEKVARIKQTDRMLDTLATQYQGELGDIRRLRKEMLEEARARATAIVEEANRKVEHTIREIREAQAQKERTRIIRENLKEFKEQVQEEVRTQEDEQIDKKMEALRLRQEKRARRKEEAAGRGAVSGTEALTTASTAQAAPSDLRGWWVGDKVRLKEGGLLGEVLGVKDKRLYVGVGQLYMWLDKDKVEPLSQNEYKELRRKQPRASRRQGFDLSERRMAFSPNLDVRGQRLEEALDTVVRFVDDAMMLGVNDLRILHGKGNGVLHQEIQRYLKSLQKSLTFEDEHVERGGSGITVIHLL